MNRRSTSIARRISMADMVCISITTASRRNSLRKAYKMRRFPDARRQRESKVTIAHAAVESHATRQGRREADEDEDRSTGQCHQRSIQEFPPRAITSDRIPIQYHSLVWREMVIARSTRKVTALLRCQWQQLDGCGMDVVATHRVGGRV